MIAMGLLGHKAQEGKVKCASLHVCPVSAWEPSCSVQGGRVTGGLEEAQGKAVRSAAAGPRRRTLGAQVLQLGK